MLKLYYSTEHNPIVVGNIRDSAFNFATQIRDEDRGIFGANLSWSKGGSGYEEFWEFAQPNGEYLIFKDPECKKPTLMAIKIRDKNNKSFAISIPSMKIGDRDIILQGNSANYNSNFNKQNLSIMSYYSSEEDLENNEAEWNYFLRKMLQTEKLAQRGELKLGLGGFSKIYFLSYACILQPFCLCSDGITAFDYTTYEDPYQVSASPFINFATMYYLVRGYKPVKAAKVKMSKNGEYTLPGISYVPDNFNTDTFLYNYNTHPVFHVKERSKTEDIDVNIGDYNITKYQRFCSPYVQIPDKFVFTMEYFISDNDYRMNSLLYCAARTKTTPNKFNSVNHSSKNSSFGYILQTSDILNLSDESKTIYADSTYLTNTTEGTGVRIPALVYAEPNTPASTFGTGSNSPFSYARYGIVANGEEYGVMTGTEISEMFYEGKVQEIEEDLPQYVIPDDDDGDGGGNGGISDSDSNGGNGTWKDKQDDFNIHDDAPFPADIGLDGNYRLVKMNRGQLIQLASQCWETDGWLAHIAKLQGSSELGQGIADVKCCFLDVPAVSTAQVSKIAGYDLSSPISCSTVQQINEVSLGSIDIPVYFDSYLDYSPYTEFVLELPFAQPVKLPPEMLIGDKLSVILRYDCLDSTALYLVKNSKKLICQLPCQLFYNIPFSSSEYTMSRNEVIANATVNLASGAGADIGGDVASSAVSGAKVGGAGGAAVGAVLGVGSAVAQVGAKFYKTAVEQESNRKITQISNGGSPGSIGSMGIKKAILKISRPYVQIPNGYYNQIGAPSGFVKKLSACKDYVEVANMKGNIRCNSDEYAEIVNALSNGVYI